MPTDDPKDPSPRRRRRATSAETQRSAEAAEGTRKAAASRARAPEEQDAPKPARRRRAKPAATSSEVDAAATEPSMDAAASTEGKADPEGGTSSPGAAPADGHEGQVTDGRMGAADPAHVERREKALSTLTELLERLEMPAQLDPRDLPDGSFSVAVRFQTLPPGVQPGRRSPFMDALQFLTNKLLHQPRTPGRRWVSLGAMEHPPPRGPPAPARPQPAPHGAAATPEPAADRPRGKGRERPAEARGKAAPEPTRADERHLEVTPDPSLAAAARKLAERSAGLGRFYTLLGMSEADRARVVQAAAGLEGQRVGCEGEGRHRRVIFRPDQPVPLPKQSLPDWDDEEDDDDAEG